MCKFKLWLEQNGAEILVSKSEYEEIRFKGSEVGIKYKSGKFNSEYAKHAYECYKTAQSWDGGPVNIGRYPSYKKQKAYLLKRDGSSCFFCGQPLGDDITVEHLISLVSGGSNTLGNMVLSHQVCNLQAHNKTIVEKVNFVLRLRNKNFQ